VLAVRRNNYQQITGQHVIKLLFVTSVVLAIGSLVGGESNFFLLKKKLSEPVCVQSRLIPSPKREIFLQAET
jgi:hypothetical protein